MDRGKHYLFDPVIYPIKLRVVVGVDAEYLNDTFVDLDADNLGVDGSFDDGYEAMSIRVGNRKSGMKEVVVLARDDSDEIVNLMCHEAFHATFAYFRELKLHIDIYDSNNTEEAGAYLNAWINKCIMSVFDIGRRNDNDNKKKRKMS